MSEKDLDSYSSPQSISDGPLDAATAEMASVGGDSPFPEGNPDSLSPSSTTATAVGATKPPPDPASNQEEVFIIDELQPAERLDDEETEHCERREEASSPSRTTSMTEDEALGISTEVHPPEDKSLEEAFEVVDIVDEYTDTTRNEMSNTAGSSLKEVKRDGKGKEREEVLKEKGKERESRKIKEREEKNGEHSEKSTKERGKKRDISPITYDKDGNSIKGGKVKEKQEPPLSGPHKINDRLFSNTRYFVMKSNNFENIDIAKDKSVWSTPPYNEKKLNKAYRDCRNVILIFSVRESGRFQGYARLASESRHDGPHVPWILPPGISQAQLGGVFRLEWIHKGSLDFNGCQELKNPWNDNKPVKISRDGQEVEPTVGERLCRLWMKIDSEEDFSISMPPVRHSSQPHPYNRHSHMSPYAPAYPPYHHHPVAGYGPMGPMMSDARGGRLLMQPSVVFPPPRLGHPPFFKARPWWGPHPPNIYPPHGPPVAMNHGPPHSSHTYGHHHPHPHNSNLSHQQPSEGGPPTSSGLPPTGGSQNFSSSNPPAHSYSAFRNNLVRTNPPPMSYSAKRMQAHALSSAKGTGEKQSPPKSTISSQEEEGNAEEEEGEKEEEIGEDAMKGDNSASA